MLILKCPKCGNQMRCEPRPGELTGKKKMCVYCGRSFGIIGNIAKRL